MKTNHKQTLEDLKKKVKEPDVLLVGVDIGKFSHSYFFDEAGRTKKNTLKLDNTREGFKELLAQIKSACKRKGAKTVIFGMEPTSVYWKPLYQFLLEQKYYTLMVESVSVHHNRKTMLGNQSKNDANDAFVICDLLKQGKIFLPCDLDSKYAIGLQRLHMLYSIQKSIRAQKNQICSMLSSAFPEYETVYKDLFSKNSLHILSSYPTPESIHTKTVREFIEEIKKEINIKEQRLTLIHNLAKESIGVNSFDKEVLLSSTEMLKRTQEQEEDMFQKCYSLASEDPRFFELLKIKGIGEKIATGLYLALGDCREIENPKQATKLAGLDVVEKTSGSSVNGVPRISANGRKLLRIWAAKAAVCVIQHPGKFLDLFNRKKARYTKKGASKKALTAVADAVIRTCCAILKREGGYDPKLDEKLRKQHSRE